MQFTTGTQQTQHQWMSNHIEFRETGKFGKMKAPQQDKQQIERQKLQQIWNSRSDLAPARYFHTTPKEHKSTSTHYKNTQQHFVWTDDQSRAAPINAARSTGKRRLSPRKTPSNNQHHQSNPIRSLLSPPTTATSRSSSTPAANLNPTTISRRSTTNKIRSSVAMNLSPNVQNLLQHQIDKPSPITTFKNVTGKRNAGLSTAVIQSKCDARDHQLKAAEKSRLSRVKEAKGTMYNSDASSYFGFKSQVLEPKPRIFSTPIRKYDSRAHTEHQCSLY